VTSETKKKILRDLSEDSIFVEELNKILSNYSNPDYAKIEGIIPTNFEKAPKSPLHFFDGDERYLADVENLSYDLKKSELQFPKWAGRPVDGLVEDTVIEVPLYANADVRGGKIQIGNLYLRAHEPLKGPTDRLEWWPGLIGGRYFELDTFVGLPKALEHVGKRYGNRIKLAPAPGTPIVPNILGTDDKYERKPL
jgi:hypothetical protein